MKQLSFNQFMETQDTRLSEVWEKKRGRLTEKSVEKRAQNMGLPGEGKAAWAGYKHLLSLQDEVIATQTESTQNNE